MGDAELTICIPTLGRPKELNACLASIKAQTIRPARILLLTERGVLAALRNDGLQRTRTRLVAFLDDDLCLSPGWVAGVLRAFSDTLVIGVTGPSCVPASHTRNRDVLRYHHGLYDWLFVGHQRLPGHLTAAGTFVPEPDWSYEGPVQFLEACNQIYRTDAAQAVGGFDEAYGGVGDWSEPDLAFRLRQRFGESCLRFDPAIAVEHRPSRSGAFLLRGPDARQRLLNYRLFSQRWVHPHWRHWVYHRFLEGYYGQWHPLRARWQQLRQTFAL